MPARQLENPALSAAHYSADLNKYDDVVLFPEKVAKAKATLTATGVAKLRKATQK